MKWERARRSTNVEDRRRGGGVRAAGGLGLGGVALVVIIGVSHHAQARHAWLEPGDIQAALNTASAIGDDRLQRRAQGTVVPDTFTHGTSAQRVRWFGAGFESGDPATCDTFAAARL